MHFWATWCGACVKGMKRLHEQYERYRGSRFAIVSISLDTDIDAIGAFRRDVWPMPWMHAHAVGGGEGETAHAFELYGAIPKSILVGPDGVIVDEWYGLRDERLDELLAEHLGNTE